MFQGMMMSGRQTTVKTIIISSNQLSGWNLITDGFAGVAPTGKAVVTITVNSGVEINGMNLTGLPDTSTILLTNNGKIHGAGGFGGTGQSLDTESDA